MQSRFLCFFLEIWRDLKSVEMLPPQLPFVFSSLLALIDYFHCVRVVWSDFDAIQSIVRRTLRPFNWRISNLIFSARFFYSFAEYNFKKKNVFRWDDAPGDNWMGRAYDNGHTTMKAKTARRRRRCRMSQTTGTRSHRRYRGRHTGPDRLSDVVISPSGFGAGIFVWFYERAGSKSGG